jgi:predicted flap endonuclease-1-like 5' DNA nuclease
MLYTIGEIIVFMLIAAIIGFVIGWLARGLSVRSRIEERLEREVAGRQLRINTLENELRDAQAGEVRAKEKTKTVAHQLEELRDLTVTLEARLGEAESASEDLAKRLAVRSGADSDETLEAMEEALRTAQADLASASSAADAAEAAVAERDERVAVLEAELVELRAAGADADQRSDLAGELDELKTAHAELQQRQRTDAQAADLLRSENTDHVRQIETLQAELEVLRQDASRGDEEVQALRAQVRELEGEDAGGEVEALSTRIDELEAEIAERDEMLEQLTEPDADTDGDDVATSPTTGESAEQGDVTSASSGESPATGGDESVPEAESAVELDAAAGATAVDDALADHTADESVSIDAGDGALPDGDPIAAIALRTSGGFPPAQDRLQDIKGVGQVLEDLLNSMGITSFRQIANFTDDDIEVLNERMGRFRDRMRRDAWMSQAADLHRQTHGTDV